MPFAALARFVLAVSAVACLAGLPTRSSAPSASIEGPLAPGERAAPPGNAGAPLEPFTPDVPRASSSQHDLAGTSWQLVQFQGGDDTTLTPDDPSKYTLEFHADGTLTVRIDCNRGRSTWQSSEPSMLRFGPLALTRAQCPEGSLHDWLVKHWDYIRSYVVQDGHLHLALMADGGIYEFEPEP